MKYETWKKFFENTCRNWKYLYISSILVLSQLERFNNYFNSKHEHFYGRYKTQKRICAQILDFQTNYRNM